MTEAPIAGEGSGQPVRSASPRTAVMSRLAILIGVIVVLLSSSPTWIHVPLRPATSVQTSVGLSGSNVAAAAVPLALVCAAGLIALALVRSWVRRLLAVLIFAAGVGVGATAIRVLADPVPIARSSNRVKTAGELVAAHVSAAPYACVLGALLIIVGALLAVRYGGRWPAPAPRYERVNAKAGRPSDAWEALEKGEDPTTGGI